MFWVSHATLICIYVIVIYSKTLFFNIIVSIASRKVGIELGMAALYL